MIEKINGYAVIIDVAGIHYSSTNVYKCLNPFINESNHLLTESRQHPAIYLLQKVLSVLKPYYFLQLIDFIGCQCPPGGDYRGELTITNKLSSKMEKAAKSNNYHYNPLLKDRARKLRKKGTKAEACLWKYALKSKMMGFQFCRQRPVLNYIADFMCKELLLIIEVDGSSHLSKDAQKRDRKRQIDLERVGFTFLRIENEGVLKNLAWTQAVISQTIEEIKLKMNPPPIPRLAGEAGLKGDSFKEEFPQGGHYFQKTQQNRII